jgi:hypothetical protein
MDSMAQGQLKEWFLMLAGWGFFGACVYLVAVTLRRMQQNAMQKHMLEKFSSAQDFAAFVQSPAGQKYVMSFSDAVTSPRNTILNSVRTGFVLMFMGAGFIVGSNAPGAHDSLNSLWFRIGWVAFLAGVGFLCSALASYFLAKKIGQPEKE